MRTWNIYNKLASLLAAYKVLRESVGYLNGILHKAATVDRARD